MHFDIHLCFMISFDGSLQPCRFHKMLIFVLFIYFMEYILLWQMLCMLLYVNQNNYFIELPAIVTVSMPPCWRWSRERYNVFSLSICLFLWMPYLKIAWRERFIFGTNVHLCSKMDWLGSRWSKVKGQGDLMEPQYFLCLNSGMPWENFVKFDTKIHLMDSLEFGGQRSHQIIAYFFL